MIGRSVGPFPGTCVSDLKAHSSSLLRLSAACAWLCDVTHVRGCAAWAGRPAGRAPLSTAELTPMQVCQLFRPGRSSASSCTVWSGSVMRGIPSIGEKLDEICHALSHSSSVVQESSAARWPGWSLYYSCFPRHEQHCRPIIVLSVAARIDRLQGQASPSYITLVRAYIYSKSLRHRDDECSVFRKVSELTIRKASCQPSALPSSSFSLSCPAFSRAAFAAYFTQPARGVPTYFLPSSCPPARALAGRRKLR